MRHIFINIATSVITAAGVPYIVSTVMQGVKPDVQQLRVGRQPLASQLEAPFEDMEHNSSCLSRCVQDLEADETLSKVQNRSHNP